MELKDLQDKLKDIDQKYDLVNVYTAECRLYCWKLDSMDDTFLFLRNNGERIRINIGEITEIGIIHQATPCSECGKEMRNKYILSNTDIAVCSVCFKKHTKIERAKKPRKSNKIDLNMEIKLKGA